MKKTIISLALAFLGIANLYAVKAKPGIAKIMLADGTVACATLHGDETFHYYMLLDGTPLRETPRRKIQKDNCRRAEHPKDPCFLFSESYKSLRNRNRETKLFSS